MSFSRNRASTCLMTAEDAHPLVARAYPEVTLEEAMPAPSELPTYLLGASSHVQQVFLRAEALLKQEEAHKKMVLARNPFLLGASSHVQQVFLRAEAFLKQEKAHKKIMQEIRAAAQVARSSAIAAKAAKRIAVSAKGRGRGSATLSRGPKTSSAFYYKLRKSAQHSNKRPHVENNARASAPSTTQEALDKAACRPQALPTKAVSVQIRRASTALVSTNDGNTSTERTGLNIPVPSPTVSPSQRCTPAATRCGRNLSRKARPRSGRLRQRAKQRWERLSRNISLLDSESPKTMRGNLGSITNSNGGNRSKDRNSRNRVPPLAPQPASTISLFDVALLNDTRPLPWFRDRLDYDANKDFEESVYVLMHPEWVRTRLPKDLSTLPMRPTRGIFADCVHQQVTWKKQVEVPHGFLLSASGFFTRLKSSGMSRPLVDLSRLNPMLGKARSPILPTPTQVIDYAMMFCRAASLDLSGWYSQIPQGWALSSITGTIVNGRHFAHVTVPQGFCEAAAAAQAISIRLCSGIEDNIAGIIYDNFLVCNHSDELLAQSTSVLRNNFERCGVVENTEKATVGAVVEYCGMYIDLQSKYWSVTDSWATKAANVLRDAVALDVWVYKIAFAVFGICGWFLRVRRQPFCFHRELLSAQRLIGRRVARGGSWSDSFTPSDALRKAVVQLTFTIAVNQLVKWSPGPPRSSCYDTIILSDASKTYGMGIVVLRDGKVIKCYGRKWTSEESKEDIHVLEFMAFIEAKKEECYGNTLFLVDNTIVVNCFAKGHSPRPNLDRLIARNAKGFNHDLGYIRTDLNLSDGASRGCFDLPNDSAVSDLLAAVSTLKGIRRVDWSYSS